MFGTHSGKISFVTLVIGGVVLLGGFALNLPYGHVPVVLADDLTTTVTVLNTAPNWTVDAEEAVESSTANPTNSESNVSWDGTATDSSGDNYFLLICKSSSTPVANADAPPDCGGGASDIWSVSATTTSGSEATVSTTTQESFAESNDWYAYICDANVTLPKCNAEHRQGSGSTASPFIVNHRPFFDAFIDDSPTDPGNLVTWYSTSTDPDTLGGNDTVRIFVCKAADFTGSACGAGGTWATSTLYTADPAASTTIAIPKQDGNYGAFGYVLDNHGHAATTTQGADSVLTISNVAPNIAASSVSLEDTASTTGSLALLTPNGQTADFKVRFTVDDNNSCQNIDGGDEFATATANVYRSGITSAGCDEAGEYDANNCYPGHVGSPTWDLSCSQDGGSCSGASDSDATWTCTFSLWYIAEPTDGSSLTDSTWFAEDWLTSARINDDDQASSTLTEASSGNELLSFLAFDVSTSSIPYGSLEPGQQTDPITIITDLLAHGNVGLDEDLYGDTMCTTWTAPDSCDANGIDSSNDITVDNQVFSTSSVAYADATLLTSSTTPTELEINVPKSTTTTTAATRDTYWGIAIPGTITQAGDYQGQDTITALKGEAQDW